MTDPIRPRSAVVIPGTPEGDAMVLEHQMRNEASALRAGRGSTERADALLAEAGRLRMHLPAAFQPELTAAIAELAAARDERAHTERPPAPVEWSAPRPDAAQRLEGRMQRALRRLPSDDRAVAQHLSRALLGHGDRNAMVRTLGRMSGNELEAMMDRAGVPEAQRGAVREGVAGILGAAFHREVVATADRTFERGIASFERAARGGRDLTRLVDDLEGPDTYRILEGLRLAGAEDEVRALTQTLERTHVDPSLRDELAPQIRREAQAAARAAAAGLREYQHDNFGTGHLADDPSGIAYTSFPAAVTSAAQRLGMNPERARDIGEPPWGHTLLERAAAEQLHAAEESQTMARRLAVGTAVVTAVVTGGTVGLPAAAVASGLVAETPELAAVQSDLESSERAASVGLASAADAREARVQRNITGAAVAVTVGAEGVGAAGAGAHGHAGLTGAAEAAVTHTPVIGNAAGHEAAHH
jgi:hypothetical protein